MISEIRNEVKSTKRNSNNIAKKFILHKSPYSKHKTAHSFHHFISQNKILSLRDFPLMETQETLK